MTRELLDILCDTWHREISADEALEEIETMETPMPKREWQGLTDEEIETIYADCSAWDKFEYERMLEAKLKQKNGYTEENT
jgi:hypothetical protein